MFKKFFVSIIVALLYVPCALSAQEQENPEVTLEPVVVTATHVEVPEEEVGKSVIVITAEELQQQKPTSLTDALHTIAGIRSGRSGYAGEVPCRSSPADKFCDYPDGISWQHLFSS